MNRAKKLFSNTLIFAISSFSSKFLVILMLPVYTSALTISDFGVSDLIFSTISLLIPVFTLSISGAALRFSLEKNSDNSLVFSYGIKVIIFGFLVLLMLNPIVNYFDTINDYTLYFYLLYITSALNNYFNLFARGIECVKLVGIVGIIGTIVVVISNIILLVIYNFGVVGYLVSYIISYTLSGLILFFGAKMYRYFSFNQKNSKFQNDMLKYCVPLVPNSVSWWVNISANRYVINGFLGPHELGLFSVATKIPSILTTIQDIFAQAWTLTAISEFDKDDRNIFFSKMYSLYNIVMVLICSIMIITIQYIASLLFSNDFYPAWIYVPYLLISVVFGSLSGFLGSLINASKKNTILFTSTILGAVTSILINILLVPQIGIMGASISSVVSYLVIWMMRLISLKKLIRLEISMTKDILSYLILVVQSILIIVIPEHGLILQLFLLLVLGVMNYDKIKNIITFSATIFENFGNGKITN